MPDILSLPNLLAWTIQSACIAIAAAVVVRVLPMPSAELRYGVWRVALFACFAAPWLPVAIGSQRSGITAVTPAFVAWESFEAVNAPASATVLPWSMITWGALGIVVLLRAMWLLGGSIRLSRLRRRGAIAETEEFADVQRALATRAEIRYVIDLLQPVTFGLRRPVILLPASLVDAPDTIRRAVVAHELLHVQRRDWAWVIGEEVLRTLCCCNLPIWWLTSRVQQAREEVVDHLTVLATGSRRAYIEALLAFADAPTHSPAPAFARRAHLFTRIVRVSKESSMSSARVLLSGLAMLLVVIGVGVYAQTAFPLIAAAQQAVADDPGQAITPDNPIPRRIRAVPAFHPAGFEDLSAVVQVRVRLDALGVPTVLGRGASAVSSQGSAAGARAPFRFGVTGTGAIDAFYTAAAEAIAEWRYEPPAEAPIEFVIALRFTPGEPTSVSQAEFSRTVSTGPAGIQVGGRMPELIDRAREELRKGREAMRVRAATEPVRVGGLIKPPVRSHDARAVYPPMALEARVQGVVGVEMVIDEEGRVADTTVVRSIPLLDQAALDAVRQWRFTPTMLNGVPVRVIVAGEVHFTLK